MSNPNIQGPLNPGEHVNPDQSPTVPLEHTTASPQDAAGFDQTQPQAAVPPRASEKPLQARLGTIVWGVLLVAFAVIVAVVQLNPATFSNAANTSVLITAGLIGAGLLLVLAGIAAAVRKK
ncbi:hypothetical protein [Lysinibacter cavernae]|uniref:Uncharacterized protein n=1 Tax=Lysinibacter cavernae TaxID=1640652 RepID=A0A7X5R454_9MICO|nr:hypothetical protein [Lysinibacter cavernae]NIH55308.1 hypothetical protein [Lysinibacter cavernae]